MVSVFVPILYLVVLMGGLGTFSYYYRRRLSQQNAATKTLMEEWFPQHTTRDIYYTLQNMAGDGEQGDAAAAEAASGEKDEKKTPAVTTALLKSALLMRAVEDIKRLQALQNRRNALNALLQRGAAAGSADLPARFAQLEEEMKAEVVDVATEAEALQPGWNQIIFATASEMVLNEKSRMRLGQIMPMAKEARAHWETDEATVTARLQRSGQQGLARRLREQQAAQAEQEATQQAQEAARDKAMRELLEMEAREAEAKGKSGGSSSAGGSKTATPTRRRSQSPKATRKKK